MQELHNIVPAEGFVPVRTQQHRWALQPLSPPTTDTLSFVGIVDHVVLDTYHCELNALLSDESDLPCTHGKRLF